MHNCVVFFFNSRLDYKDVISIQYSALQCSAVQCITVQHSTVQSVQRAVQCSTVQNNSFLVLPLNWFFRTNLSVDLLVILTNKHQIYSSMETL